MSYYIETLKDTTYDDLITSIQLFLDKEDHYYSNKYDFDRKVVSCSIIYVDDEFIATILYNDIWK